MQYISKWQKQNQLELVLTDQSKIRRLLKQPPNFTAFFGSFGRFRKVWFINPVKMELEASSTIIYIGFRSIMYLSIAFFMV